MDVRIEPSWKAALSGEFEKPYFSQLVRFLHAEKAAGKVIYPPGNLIFRAFELTPVPEVKVVIMGQDPYHGPCQAMGLSFSVPDGVRTPPSLRNIFQEIESDMGICMSGRPNLEPWARQGVLLLNSSLTVEAGVANSHSRIGWQTFTDAVISYLSSHCEGIVFLLWGRFAQEKAALIDTSRHHVLMAAHPSPLAGGAFFGCRHFSRANAFLTEHGEEPVDWTIR
jgi:uracil-DNA glycosylase